LIRKILTGASVFAFQSNTSNRTSFSYGISCTSFISIRYIMCHCQYDGEW